MNEISPSDLKTILHSKRANLYYLEHCRVLVSGGRVEYVTKEGSRSLSSRFPIAHHDDPALQAHSVSLGPAQNAGANNGKESR